MKPPPETEVWPAGSAVLILMVTAFVYANTRKLTSVGQSCNNDAAASPGWDQEAGLDDGDDGQTLCLCYHMSCNTREKDAVTKYINNEESKVSVFLMSSKPKVQLRVMEMWILPIL